jgi:hypothetical protein
MTFIDWSDPEEMLGLLTEYVADARNDARADPARVVLLAALLHDLTELSRLSEAISLHETMERLRRIHESHADDLSGDPVFLHVEDCIAELDRIRGESGEAVDRER